MIESANRDGRNVAVALHPAHSSYRIEQRKGEH